MMCYCISNVDWLRSGDMNIMNNARSGLVSQTTIGFSWVFGSPDAKVLRAYGQSMWDFPVEVRVVFSVRLCGVWKECPRIPSGYKVLGITTRDILGRYF